MNMHIHNGFQIFNVRMKNSHPLFVDVD